MNSFIIESQRLFLRNFTLKDVDKMSEIYSDDAVMKYIGRGGKANREQTQQMIEAFIKSYQKNGFGIYALIEKESDELTGHCGFNRLPNDEIEIAYLIEKKNWRKGYATEISAATLQYGFEKIRLNRIVALAYPENTASIKVINKIGMKQEGEIEFFGKMFLYFGIGVG